MRPSRLFNLAAVVAGSLLGPVQIHGQEIPSDTLLTVNHYLNWERVSDPQISPDGSTIVYTRSYVNQMEDRWESELWVMNADGSKHRFLAKGSSPRWSPDGTRIAYLAQGEPKGTQIFVRWMDAEGATSQITRVTETPSGLRWSPDGRWIAFAMLVPEKETWSISMPTPPEGAKWTEPPRMITTIHYRIDRQGFFKPGSTHVFVVPAEGGTPRQVTRGPWTVGARFSGIPFGIRIDWTPDGKTLLVDGIQGEGGLDRYGESYVYAVDVASGEARQLVGEKGWWRNPIVSPDGRRVLFSGYRYTTQSYRAEDLYVVGIDGQGRVKISGDLDRDPEDVFWSPDGRAVYFTAGDRGSRNIYRADLSGRVQQVTTGVHMLSLSSLAKSGVGVGVRSAPHEPEDVVRIDLPRGAAITQLTAVNDDVLANKRLAEVEEIWYTSTDNTRVQGWIVKPPSFDPSKKYPLILEIHGGPHAMYNVGFSYSFQNFAANGYVVLYTNPRGSTGYGTAFGNAIDNGYPGVDYYDLMAGVDSLVQRGYIDTDRMYVGGCSGGGVLSSWTIGHTDRFAAAAVRCPVTNWMSFAGTTDVVQWAYHRFQGYFWENPAKWLEHSPLMHVGKVKTPTLLMTGELDLRTPIAQTEEYYAALKIRGVPAVMLRFHDEYHGTGSKPSNFMRTQLYMMDWFRQHSKKAAASSP